MTVLGLLLTMTGPADRRHSALCELVRRPGVELGPASGDWQPLTIEAPSPAEARRTLRWLETLSGVGLVQLVRAYWYEPQSAERGQGGASRVAAQGAVR